MPSKKSMDSFAKETLRSQLDTVVFEMNRAAKLLDEESVHKLRVSIRRFQQGLRLFRDYVPKRGLKKVRTDVRNVLKLAGEVRNCDIAIQLLETAKADAAPVTAMRTEAKRALAGELHHLGRPRLSSRWRSQLGLDAA